MNGPKLVKRIILLVILGAAVYITFTIVSSKYRSEKIAERRSAQYDSLTAIPYIQLTDSANSQNKLDSLIISGNHVLVYVTICNHPQKFLDESRNEHYFINFYRKYVNPIRFYQNEELILHGFDDNWPKYGKYKFYFKEKKPKFFEYVVGWENFSFYPQDCP